MEKIHNDQLELNSRRFESNRAKIRGLRSASHTFVDMLVTMEHAASAFRDVFSTPVLSKNLDEELRRKLSDAMQFAEKWNAVRNKLGGHIDIDIIQSACIEHKFKGVHLSNDLETDVSAFNAILLEAAFNESGCAEKELGRRISTRDRGLAPEINVMVSKLNDDWDRVFACFPPLLAKMYEIGKSEKEAVTLPIDRRGLIVGD
jgi:hypothetical protein